MAEPVRIFGIDFANRLVPIRMKTRRGRTEGGVTLLETELHCAAGEVSPAAPEAEREPARASLRARAGPRHILQAEFAAELIRLREEVAANG